MQRAVIYARLSQSERTDFNGLQAQGKIQETSLKDQINACQKLADDEGYEVVDEAFVDDGKSAYLGKYRPGYMDLIERVRKGDIEVILAVEDSRLTRDTESNVRLQAECIKFGMKWHTVAGGLTDPNQPEGRMMATIKAAIDEYESAVKALRVQRSVQRRLEALRDIGGPRPFGWEKDRFTVREEEAALLRRAYDELNSGTSLYKIAKEVFEASEVRPPRARNSVWRTQTVRNIMLQPRHYGQLVVKGVDYGSFGKGIVSEEVWQKAHAILTNPARDRRRGAKDKYFTGIARCGTCGSRMGAADSSATRCRREGDRTAEGRHASIKQDILEESILRAVENAFIFGRIESLGGARGDGAEASFILSEETRISEAIRQTMFDRNNGAPAEIANAEISRLTSQLADLKAQREDLQAKNAAAEILMSAASKVFKGRKVSLSDGAEKGKDIRAAFLGLSVERQRGLLETLIDVRVHPGGRGAKRVQITQKVATQINGKDDERIPTDEEIADLERYEVRRKELSGQ